VRNIPAIVAAAWFACSVPALALDLADPSGDRHARNQLAIGIDLLQHGKYEEAAPRLEIALDKFPDNVSILKDLAYIHRMIAKHRVGTAHDGEVQLANAYYGRALDIDPSNRNLLEYMGEFYLELDDPAAAQDKLAALERRCPEGCPQRDALAHSIASYTPPPPPAATAPPEPLTPESPDAEN
jgi:tetratricopeptide (TPR) repeat protein